MMTTQLLFIGTTELLLIGGIALLLFGGKKLPEMMRGLGQGVKEFKKGVNDVENSINAENDDIQGDSDKAKTGAATANGDDVNKAKDGTQRPQ